MAGDQYKPLASGLLFLNFCMYAIVAAIGGWAVNIAIDEGFFIGTNLHHHHLLIFITLFFPFLLRFIDLSLVLLYVLVVSLSTILLFLGFTYTFLTCKYSLLLTYDLLKLLQSRAYTACSPFPQLLSHGKRGHWILCYICIDCWRGWCSLRHWWNLQSPFMEC